ncbi:MAG: 5'-3' exonuclease H3TH domain-containing protein [Deltaproteobacteria bacterium]|nr:5'-3' exonuclease H3TH domain-containing protein [Deltaproteobacteria bacterium]
MQVHVVDGTFELFRCFFGAPPRQTSGGLEVGATRGIIGTLLSLLKEPDCAYVGVAFDTVIESFRNELFAGYKTGAGIDPNLMLQFPLAEKATRAMGLVTWSMIRHECDDALATMATRAAADPRVTRVNICSPDKDLAQCVTGDRVVLVDRLRKTTLDEAGVALKFGVPPRCIPDLLALIGDTADGVPGLPGFGEKSAAALLRKYGSVEAIPDGPWPKDVGVRGADKLAATLAASRPEVTLYKKLTTLVLDVPLTETVDDLQWRGPDASLLAALAHEIEDDGLVSRVDKVWSARA